MAIGHGINILVDFGPLKKGGGQNVGLNFIEELKKEQHPTFNFYFVVCKNSKIHDAVKDSVWNSSFFVVSQNPIVRVLQELTQVTRYLKNNNIELVYSYFGFALLATTIKQVIGSADSNLYFPEIDFWKDEPLVTKFKRYLVDKYRVWGVKNAHAVIFENKAMFERATKLFNVINKKLIYPSITVPISQKEAPLEVNDNNFRVLILCSWQRNKNILLIPEIAKKISVFLPNIEFVITANYDGSVCSSEFKAGLKEFSVERYVSLIGTVEKVQLKDLYNKSNCLLLLSKLESFSNNIIECWQFEIPLLVADEIWARSICKSAAFYVDRDDPSKIADGILELYNNTQLYDDIVSDGRTALEEYPNIRDRLKQELLFLAELLK